jgi:hypothetical protein
VQQGAAGDRDGGAAGHASGAAHAHRHPRHGAHQRAGQRRASRGRGTINSTLDYTPWTLYRFYFKRTKR